MDIVRSNLVYLMKATGINQSHIEVMTQGRVKQNWVSRYLDGTIKKANPEKIQLIAQVYQVSAADMMFKDLSQPGVYSASQPVQLERQIMEAAKTLVQLLESFSPIPLNPAGFGARLEVAAKLIREEGLAALDDGKRREGLIRSFAERLRKVG